MAEVINAGTQPIQNIPVMALHSEVPAEQKKWAQHWIHSGLSIFETLSEKSPGRFAFGNEFTLADVCLIPQIYNAERFEVSLAPFPRIQEAYQNSKLLYAVTSSHPSVYEIK
jgi:glutathione S-transferase